MIQTSLERTTKELETEAQRAQKLRHDYEVQLMAADQLAQDNQHKDNQLKVRKGPDT